MEDNGFVKKAMVIGGGIAGISASIDLRNGGMRWSWWRNFPLSEAGCFSFLKLSPHSIAHSAP